MGVQSDTRGRGQPTRAGFSGRRRFCLVHERTPRTRRPILGCLQRRKFENHTGPTTETCADAHANERNCEEFFTGKASGDL